GAITDVFLPIVMHAGVNHPEWNWFRMFALLKPSIATAPVQERLRATFQAFQEERAERLAGQPREVLNRILSEKLRVEPAEAGVSGAQRKYRASLEALGVLVALLLLIACANVANLMTAQAAARSREMALRVSMGAGRRRLIQMIMIESTWIALFAAIVGG